MRAACAEPVVDPQFSARAFLLPELVS